MNNIFVRTKILWAITLVFLVVGVAGAQDFQKTYPIGPGGSISIKNVSGDVNVKGFDGQAVSVQVFKEGRDRDKVNVEDTSSGNRVELRARYQENCNCDASLRFEVQIPRNGSYNLDKISTASGNINVVSVNGQIDVRTASGDVQVEGVTGDVDASTASGKVSVKNIAGVVSAKSASGDVDAEITRIEGTGDMKFTSASGDVHVRMPANLDADVKMSTFSGTVQTDFPLEIRKHENGSGSDANGRLGAGTRNVRISSASGNVSLTKM